MSQIDSQQQVWRNTGRERRSFAMLCRTQRCLYRVYGGKVFLDLNINSTLEPHAEKFKFENVPVDPTVNGLVLPLNASGDALYNEWMSPALQKHEPLETQSLPTLRSVASELGIDCSTSSKLSKTGLARYLREVAGGELLKKPGVPANLLQSVFQSWPRLHHQREFERPYLDKRIQVLELGPFEVLLGGMERPMVCNVQFSPDMPLTQDGKPDVRIGRDLLRRSHYLFPEQMRGGLVDSVYKDAPRKGVDLRRVAAYGSVPNVSDGVRTDGEGRLYTDDKIRFGWAVVDGQVREEPPVPLSTTVDLVGDQMAARKAASRTEGGAAEGGAASPTAVGGKKAAKTWRGWK